MLVRSAAVVVALLATSPASATIDEQCQELASGGPPEDYSEVAQQDFLQNYFALTTTYSALHAPVPHEPGHGSVGLDAGFIPPLGCRRRLVLAYTKTEDVNKSPVFPRVRVSFAFSRMGQMVPYASFAYTPPIRVGGVSASAVSGEAGVGFQLGDTFQLGARFHATQMRTVAEIATPFVEGDTEFDDVYWASTFGVDALVGLDLDVVTPYVAVGITDASNFFYVGDDSVVVNNFHPYLGAVFSAGAQALVAERLSLAGELYAAPGGYNLPDPTIETLDGAGRYGSLLTVRARVALEL